MILSEKEKSEWKEKYINRFVECGLTRGFGEDDPVLSADESLSYWTD